MLRVKVFSSAVSGGDSSPLEDGINRWLESVRPVVRQVTQSSVADQVIVLFLYEERHGDAQVRARSAEVPEAFGRSLNESELDPADDEPTELPEAELPY
ncbi:MAG: hypothetical protein ACM3N4_11075 [Nitrososphaerota archaeon]